ncbi:MAG: hypothetical protein WA979_06785 [Pacificimonas sp.]
MHFPYLVGGLALVASLTATAAAYADTPSGDAAPEYVRFEPLIVPIFDTGAEPGLVGVQIVLRTYDPAERTRLENLRPRLNDAWLHALAEHGRLYLAADRPIDVIALQAALEDASEPHFGGNTHLLIVEEMAYAA